MGDVPAGVAMLVVGVVLASALLRSYSESERSLLWTSFAVHVASAVAMIVIVRGVYGSGDMFGYFDAGRFFAARLRSDFLEMAPRLLEILFQRSPPLPIPWVAVGSNTGSMQAISGFICLFSGDSIYSACLLVAFASFVAKLTLFKAMKTALPEIPSARLIIACMLVPSAVYWSSGLLKEPIAVVGLSMMVHGGSSVVHHNRRFAGLLFIIGGGVLTGLFKGYLLPPFGIGAGFFYVSRAIFASRRTIQPRFLLLAAVLAAVSILITGAALPHFAPDTFEEEARSAQAIGYRTEGGSNYSLGDGGLVSQVPLALVTVLYRPFIFEASNMLMFISALETLAAAILTVLALSRTPWVETVRYVLGRPVLCFCLGFVLTLAVGVGLTTTNLGTLSRYRMPLVPFYATLLVVLWSRRTEARVIDRGATATMARARS
jgi:hypothetical protein